MYNTDTLIIHEFAVSDLHFAMVYGLRTDLGGCKIPGEDAPRPPYKFLHFAQKFVQM